MEFLLDSCIMAIIYNVLHINDVGEKNFQSVVIIQMMFCFRCGKSAMKGKREKSEMMFIVC